MFKNPRPEPPPLVLLVEDDPFILEMVAEELACGCDVLAVATAEAAMAVLDLCAGGLSALVVDVDLGSPTLTGLDVARRARTLNPLVAVIYATGRTADEMSGRAVQGSAHLGKPYCIERLRRLVGTLTAEALAPSYVALPATAA